MELLSARRARARRRRQVLTPGGEEVLRAMAPVALGPLLDVRRPAGAAALDAAIADVDDYLAYLSAPLQRQMRLTLAALATLPVRVVLLRTTAPWRAASATRVEGALIGLRESRVPALRRLFGVLHSVIMLGCFDQPQIWEQIGYPGPPAESAAIPGGAR